MTAITRQPSGACTDYGPAPPVAAQKDDDARCYAAGSRPAFNEILEHAELLCGQISRGLRTADHRIPLLHLAYPRRKRVMNAAGAAFYRKLQAEEAPDLAVMYLDKDRLVAIAAAH